MHMHMHMHMYAHVDAHVRSEQARLNRSGLTLTLTSEVSPWW